MRCSIADALSIHTTSCDSAETSYNRCTRFAFLANLRQEGVTALGLWQPRLSPRLQADAGFGG
jgi:hypothetical protein